MSEVKHRCCDAFEASTKDGTDNEAWEPLTYVDEETGSVRMGNDRLPPIKFCPWCGVEVLK